jgi:hypothetical protein
VQSWGNRPLYEARGRGRRRCTSSRHTRLDLFRLVCKHIRVVPEYLQPASTITHVSGTDETRCKFGAQNIDSSALLVTFSIESRPNTLLHLMIFFFSIVEKNFPNFLYEVVLRSSFKPSGRTGCIYVERNLLISHGNSASLTCELKCSYD